jgi:hypothetical protein
MTTERTVPVDVDLKQLQLRTQALKELGADDQASLLGRDKQVEAGVVVWWTLGAATHPEPLEDLGKKWFTKRRFQPKPRSWGDCLQECLKVKYPTRSHLIIKCKKEPHANEVAAYEVRQIIIGVHENQLPIVGRGSLSMPPGYATPMFYFKEEGSTIAMSDQTSTDLVKELRKALPAASVRAWLVEAMLDKKLAGSRCLASGGNYFIPDATVPLLLELRNVVANAAAVDVLPGTKNRLTVSRLPMSPELLEDITENLETQFDLQLRKTQNYIATKPGLIGLRRRQEEMEDLLTHLQRYKSILDKADRLDLEKAIDQCKTTLGVEIARAQGASEQQQDDGKKVDVQADLASMLGL